MEGGGGGVDKVSNTAQDSGKGNDPVQEVIYNSVKLWTHI